MNPLSFMSANFVARQNGYQAQPDWHWGHYDQQVQVFFRPLETYAERMAVMLDEIAGAGFTALDLWVAHLHPAWATLEHVAIFQELCTARRLRCTSLAGGFGDTLPALRASCRLAAALNIPILGGSTPLLTTDRSGLVQTLRDFGLILALENHPEKSPAEVLAQLGEGDEDVLQVALDTGWFATHGYPADQALRELAPRLGLVHLKDIRRSGEHVTCPLGQGIVPVRECLEVLRELDFRGSISIEHEPFDSDPRPGCIAGRELVSQFLADRSVQRGPSPVGMALLGCGNIAWAYVRQLAGYPEVRLVGVFDADSAKAQDLAQQNQLQAYESLEALLADPAVEVVVNLTIHHAHFETTRRCLEAGKHVHSEKPLATDQASAAALVRLAEEKGLRLSSAPTTWLGEAQQTAWAYLEAGRLGTPRVAYAEVNWGRIEEWHPNPAPFYAVGPIFDVAVYPLTLLTAWFGPVRKVLAGGGILYPHRHTKDGTPFTVGSADWSSAVVEHASGLTTRLTSSFYVSGAVSQSGLEIHGDLGSLRLSRWDVFDASLEIAPLGKPMRRVALGRPGYHGIEYARGTRDLAQALREDRPHRCAGSQAAHIVEVCEAILHSIRKGQTVAVTSDFPAPEPLEWAKELATRLR